MVDLNELASWAYETALMRKKTRMDMSNEEVADSLQEELDEFRSASNEKESEHLLKHTEAEEELADIMIGCLTEMAKRGVDAEGIIREKMLFNVFRR